MKRGLIVAGAGLVGCALAALQLALYAACIYGVVRLVRYAWGS